MAKFSTYEQFEQQIARIHKLIEAQSAEVIWDDHIPDPDNATQLRQIDISVRRDGVLTLIECRMHKAPQDVTWIEELIGRRQSLAASNIIAVSTSGFTAPAQNKANRYGIFLRNVDSLSEREVQDWGRRNVFTVNFCEFSKVVCRITINAQSLLPSLSLTRPDGRPIESVTWVLIFKQIMNNLEQNSWSGSCTRVNMRVSMPILVGGRSPEAVEVSADVRRIVREVPLASVVEYREPKSRSSAVTVGHFNLGNSEIIENADALAMTIDLSQIEIPEGCCFESRGVDFNRIVGVSPKFIGFGVAAKWQNKNWNTNIRWNIHQRMEYDL